MKHFTRVAPPPAFALAAEQPGAAWLALNPAPKRPRDLWSPFRAALADGFGNLCGYGAMYEPVGTVDHFVSCNEDRTKAYDWTNYRFCSGWLNSSKQGLRAEEVLDPYEVEDGWFEITLPSLQLVLTDRVPAELRVRALTMLVRLHLGHDERVVRQRRAWMQMYEEKQITLEGLRGKAPLLAEAIERAGQRAPR